MRGNCATKPTRIPKGLANAVYKLETSTGAYILKIAIRHNSDLINFELDLLNQIKSPTVPRPLMTKGGGKLFFYKGHRAFVYQLLRGEERSDFSPDMLYQIGVFLGDFHTQTKEFTSGIKRTEWYNISTDYLSEMVSLSRAHISNEEILKQLDYLETHTLEYGPPLTTSGAVHMDVKPQNVLFEGDMLTGVIDFDNSYIGPSSTLPIR